MSRLYSRCLSCTRFIWMAFAVLLLISFVGFNIIIVVTYKRVSSLVAEWDPRSNDWYQLIDNLPVVRDVIQSGKQGKFVKLQQETLERVYIITQDIPQDKDTNSSGHRHIASLGLDVSHSGESMFIYQRILSLKKFPYAHLVIDIGANDGILSSNSFNFIKWGWDAILVEPLRAQMAMARLNHERYLDPYNLGKQSVRYVEAALSDQDGTVEFVLTPDLVNMENHIARGPKRDSNIVKVKSMTVKTFTESLQVPQRFGILSIDAEGKGDVILHQWMDLNFKPAYVIYEAMHNREPLHITIDFLTSKGYRYVNKRGWNHIFELKELLL